MITTFRISLFFLHCEMKGNTSFENVKSNNIGNSHEKSLGSLSE